MGPKRFYSLNFSLFLDKYNLGFSAPLNFRNKNDTIARITRIFDH